MIQTLGAIRVSFRNGLTDFSLGRATTRQESLDLRTILIQVVVIDVLNAVDVEDRRLVEVVSERH